MSHPARILPPLNELLDRRKLRGLTKRLRRDIVVTLCRELLQEERDALAARSARARSGAAETRPALYQRLEAEVLARAEALLRPRLRSVLNASGVLLHTNLGRARLCDAAALELARVARETVALEIDLGPVRIPIELRGGYNTGFRKDLSERAEASGSGTYPDFRYDGKYEGHFAMYTGILYSYDLEL